MIQPAALHSRIVEVSKREAGDWLCEVGSGIIQHGDVVRRPGAGITTTCTGAAEAQFTWLFVVPFGGPVMSSVRRPDE